MNTASNVLDQRVVENIASKIFSVQPMLRKRVQRFEGTNAGQSMPLSHVQVLSVLNDEGSMTVSDISRRFNIAKPNITPLVDRLFEAGYVDRQHDDNDRRVVNIVLMPAGAEKLAAIRATIARQIQVQAESLTVSEFRELNESLQSIVRILSSL